MEALVARTLPRDTIKTRRSPWLRGSATWAGQKPDSCQHGATPHVWLPHQFLSANGVVHSLGHPHPSGYCGCFLVKIL
jgi:hypothetical protein